MAENVLHIENVTMQFGGVVAVNNLNLDVNKGEIQPERRRQDHGLQLRYRRI